VTPPAARAAVGLVGHCAWGSSDVRARRDHPGGLAATYVHPHDRASPHIIGCATLAAFRDAAANLARM
jgi:hypothetical protein